jgi:hypothetical protein
MIGAFSIFFSAGFGSLGGAPAQSGGNHQPGFIFA